MTPLFYFITQAFLGDSRLITFAMRAAAVISSYVCLLNVAAGTLLKAVVLYTIAAKSDTLDATRDFRVSPPRNGVLNSEAGWLTT